jgi:hypothetical protein
VSSGGGIVISQDRRDEIIAAATDLLTDKVKRSAMAKTAIASRHRGVAQIIAERVLEVANDDAQ